jgi:hypothetical protein
MLIDGVARSLIQLERRTCLCFWVRIAMCASPSCAVAGREKGKENTQNERNEECRYSAISRLPRKGHFLDRGGHGARRATG